LDSFLQFVNLLYAPLPMAFIALALMLLFSAFLKVSIIFGFLRVGLGLDSIGGTFLTAGVSLVIALFIMNPTLERTFSNLPVTCETEKEACLMIISENWKEYVKKEVTEQDKEKFSLLVQAQRESEGLNVTGLEKESWQTLAPAFVLSEIKKAFSIGIKILLPFLVIDLLIAYLFTALSVSVLSASALAFPLKILAFTVLDGWSLVVENVIKISSGV